VAPLIFFRISDTVDIEDDLKFSDETIQDVRPTSSAAAVEKVEV
jgi:hypothetical protein